MEIAEDLNRAALERDEHVAESLRLAGSDWDSARVAPEPQGGRSQGAQRAAAREINVNSDDARHAEKVPSLALWARAWAACRAQKQ